MLGSSGQPVRIEIKIKRTFPGFQCPSRLFLGLFSHPLTLNNKLFREYVNGLQKIRVQEVNRRDKGWQRPLESACDVEEKEKWPKIRH